MKPPTHPLEIILRDIEGALSAGLWYLAIAVALSIPDICSLLERDSETDGWSKQHKYAGWFDTWVKNDLANMTGDDCYQLRGGVLHNGKFQHAKLRYNRIVFMVPPQIATHLAGNASISNGQHLMSYGVETFCNTMIAAARRWAEAKRGDPIVEANLPNLVRYRPNGIPRHFDGFPVIA